MTNLDSFGEAIDESLAGIAATAGSVAEWLLIGCGLIAFAAVCVVAYRRLRRE